MRAVRIRAWSESSGCAHALDLAVLCQKSLRKSPSFAQKSLIVDKPCINPGKSLPLL
nr:MAG TPA: carboxypeptidase [Caudoviricetes sp.]